MAAWHGQHSWSCGWAWTSLSPRALLCTRLSLAVVCVTPDEAHTEPWQGKPEPSTAGENKNPSPFSGGIVHRWQVQPEEGPVPSCGTTAVLAPPQEPEAALRSNRGRNVVPQRVALPSCAAAPSITSLDCENPPKAPPQPVRTQAPTGFTRNQHYCQG